VKSTIPIPAADALLAPMVTATMVATVAARNRIIHSPSKKIIQWQTTGHICRRFASHGRVRAGGCRYQIGNRLKTLLAKPAHRSAGQGRDARYCFDGPSEQ
jgi:hypothetical protein